MTIQEFIERLQKMQAELEALGCEVYIEVDGASIKEKPARKPKGKPRLSEAQKAILLRIKHEGSYKYPTETKTLDSMLKKGLITRAYQWPLPGNDYGGTWVYTMTPVGEAALK